MCGTKRSVLFVAERSLRTLITRVTVSRLLNLSLNLRIAVLHCVLTAYCLCSVTQSHNSFPHYSVFSFFFSLLSFTFLFHPFPLLSWNSYHLWLWDVLSLLLLMKIGCSLVVFRSILIFVFIWFYPCKDRLHLLTRVVHQRRNALYKEINVFTYWFIIVDWTLGF